MEERTAVRRKWWLWALLCVALLGLWVAVAPSVADGLVVDKPLEKADAIIILSGAADYAQRTRGGAEAFLSGVAPRVFITDDKQRGGWDDVEKENPYFVERMHAALIESGVPESAIERIPGYVKGTSDEAGSMIRMAHERHFTSVLVVTSDYHSRRALWTFERFAKKDGTGLNIGIFRASSGDRYPDRYTWWLTPRGWRTVGAEYVKFCWYWFFY